MIASAVAQALMVAVNQAFRKGELTDKSIDQIVSDVAKILPK
jgi:hypothetical protein